ncbi:MAG: SH3 domain-containing protein [Caldilineaceae bacterium]
MSTRSTIKILFLAANPQETTPLQIDQEMRAVDQALRRAEYRDQFDLRSHWAVHYEDLQELLLRHKPDILHFSGHGSPTGEIILQSAHGLQGVGSEALGRLFAILKDNLRCVVLNACYSETQAQTVAQHIDCVVGMSDAITDATAINFAAAFYQGLGYGRSIKAAFDLGCNAIDLATLAEQDKPQLLAPRCDPDQVLVLTAINGLGSDDTAPAPGLSPYKGLQFFDTGDAGVFFGREALTAELVTHLRHHHFLAVVGASGSGKSSLVRAGLAPTLAGKTALPAGTVLPKGSERWPVHIITPSVHPLKALAVTLTRESESVTAATTLLNDLAQDERSLDLYVNRLLSQRSAQTRAPDDRLLLIVDQFEELFTLCRDKEERRCFVANLLQAAAPDGVTMVVLTLRADFYAQCAEFEALRLALASRQQYIGPMQRDELRRAIEEPARLGQWEFEQGLVDLLLEDVDEEPGALPLLSNALLETWQRRQGRTMTLAGYTAAGRVQGAIAQTANQVYGEMSQAQQQLTRNIFLRLTQLGEGTQDTRRRVELDELFPQQEDPHLTEGVLKLLTDSRLITTYDDEAEVAHEALIREWPTLRAWLNENREGLRLHRQLTEAAQEWDQLERDLGALLRGRRLEQTLEWAAQHGTDLNELEQTFVAASQAQRDEEAHEVARIAQERESTRQRELEQARQLAEHQSQSAAKLRRRAIWLGLTSFIALLLAIAALRFGLSTNQALLRAEIAQQTAVAGATTAAQARDEAVRQAAAARTAEALAESAEATAQSEVSVARTAEAETLASQARSSHLAAALSYTGEQLDQIAWLFATSSATLTVTSVPTGTPMLTRQPITITPTPAFVAAVVVTQTAVQPGQLYAIIPDIDLNLYAQASSAAPVLQTLRAPAQLPVLQADTDWVQIVTADGITGWVDAASVYYVGADALLPSALRYLRLKDQLPFIYGRVINTDGAASYALLDQPDNPESIVTEVPVDTDVIVLFEGEGPEVKGSNIWYYLSIVDPTGENRLLRGYLPAAVIAARPE